MNGTGYRTVLTDLSNLRKCMESVEARLNEIRDMIVDDREDVITYETMLSYALHIEGVAASARKVLALTGDQYP